MISRRTAELAPLSAEQWSGPPLHLGAGQVLLDAGSARVMLLVLAAYLRSESARNGGTALGGQLRSIDVVLRAAVTSGASGDGRTDVRKEVDPTPWDQDDVMTTKEVAEMLGVSEHEAARLARVGRFGTTRKAGRAHLVQRAEVEAVRNERQAG